MRLVEILVPFLLFLPPLFPEDKAPESSLIQDIYSYMPDIPWEAAVAIAAGVAAAYYNSGDSGPPASTESGSYSDSVLGDWVDLSKD